MSERKEAVEVGIPVFFYFMIGSVAGSLFAITVVLDRIADALEKLVMK